MTDALNRLEALVQDHGEDLPLGLAAAVLAQHEDPRVDPDEVGRRLDELAAGVRVAEGTEPIEVVARLQHRLFVELGFGGDRDTYDHPDNSRIDRVLDRRRGLPITLAVVYIEVAARKGLAVDPIGFPAHFLVSPRTEPRFYVDVFNGGRIFRRESLVEQLVSMGQRGDLEPLLSPVSGAAVLARMSHNLLGSHRRRGDADGVERAMARLRVLGAL